MQLVQFVGLEDRQGPLQLREPDASQLQHEPSAFRREVTLDDATVVDPMAPLDEAVTLDALDETARARGREVEQRGDATHRLRSLPVEQQQEPELAEREIGGRTGTACRGERPEHAQDVCRDRLEVTRRRVRAHVVPGRYFTHT